MCALFFGLYRVGVVPYYLYHFMPFSPDRRNTARGSPISSLSCRIKRRKSNIAVPEYVLPHARGKFTVPLILKPEEYPRFEELPGGGKAYRFFNWLGERHDWAGF